MGSLETSGRLLTEVVDQQAQQQPESLYCLHPISHDANCEWHPISFKQLADAVDRVAWWIDQKLPGKKQQVLAYIGTNDLRYLVFILACIKTGHAALLLSTRNSLSGFRHLLSATHCSVLVDGSERRSLQDTLDQIEAKCPDLGIERWRIEGMWDIFAPSTVTPYPHREHFTDIEDRTAIIIHSSGTTGLPKPVFLTHGYLATMDQMQTLPVPTGRETAQMFLRYRGQMRMMYGPLFHFVGLVCMSECIFFQTPFLLAPDRPMTPDLFVAIMATNNPPRWGMFIPYMLEVLQKSDKGRQALARLSGLNYGGAPLSSATGDVVSSLLRLQTLMGSSETGYTPTLLCQDPADWEYFEWNPAFEHRMEEINDGLWELVIPRPASRRYHGIFHTHPHLTVYHTGDLFEPHPVKPNLWRSKGRKDDVIVLSNGEKFNPIDAERLLETHPRVHRAAIFGQDRFQAALLVEPEWNELPPTWTLEWLQKDVAPLVDQANALLPAHGQIHPTHIAFASRNRPFALTPKGSVRRRETSQLYQPVLDRLYAPEANTTKPITQLEKPRESSAGEIQQWVQVVVAQILGQSIVSPDDDIVTLGMDSLQVARLAQVLQDAARSMHPSQPHVLWSSAEVYEKATVRHLADALFQQIHGPDANDRDTSNSGWPREHRLTHAIWQQTQGLGYGGLTVVLTGSTGELGSYLLHELLRDPTVGQIYCLNRSQDAKARQLAHFKEKRLADGWLTDTSRVQFWQIQLDKENLGLAPAEYSLLRERVNVVLHNAWSVNFNQPLASFGPHLEGLRRLLQVVEGTSRPTEFHFVSSVATVSNRSDTFQSKTIAETLHDSSIVFHQGYAESKFVAEALCGIVAQRGQTRIAIHRVGQLGGPSNLHAGMWTPRDWFPVLVRSSQTMGEVPDSLGLMPVDWVPINTAAEGIVQIMRGRRESSATSSKAEVYHIMNPHTSPWAPLAQVVSQACEAKIIPLVEWVRSLRRHASELNTNPDSLRDLPAAKLLGLYEMMAEASWVRPPAETTNAQKYSAAMRALGPVDVPMMELWLRQWKDWIPGLKI
ncbi:NRPS-like enzyme [Aspergillus coremiiformis]|uniref:NRPS-like enzyme n=1 Tax=Aspergillus coremiiformis TaxID=138285 RepID=A0A5N6ZF83_9EURO|nr:NRPS-like enzyme [Aspergillus coremiiformis]